MWYGQNHGRGSRAVRSLLRNAYFESTLSATMTYQEWVNQLIEDDDSWQWQGSWDSWSSWHSWWSSWDNWRSDQSHEWHPNEEAGAQQACHWHANNQQHDNGIAAPEPQLQPLPVQGQQPTLGATTKAVSPVHYTAVPKAAVPVAHLATAAAPVAQSSSSSGSADGIGHVAAPWHVAARGSVAAQVRAPWHQTRDAKRSKQEVKVKTPSPQLSPITEAEDEVQHDEHATVEIDIKCEADEIPELPDDEVILLNNMQSEQLLEALHRQVDAANASCNMRGTAN